MKFISDELEHAWERARSVQDRVDALGKNVSGFAGTSFSPPTNGLPVVVTAWWYDAVPDLLPDSIDGLEIIQLITGDGSPALR